MNEKVRPSRRACGSGRARCWNVWYCPRLAVCLLPQQSHRVYHVARFVYIKGRVCLFVCFLIYSQIILVMTQICNKSHPCCLDVSTLRFVALECPPGTSDTRASQSRARRFSTGTSTTALNSHSPCLWCPPVPPGVPQQHLRPRWLSGAPSPHVQPCPEHLRWTQAVQSTHRHLSPGRVPFLHMAPSTQLLRSKTRTPPSPCRGQPTPSLQALISAWHRPTSLLPQPRQQAPPPGRSPCLHPPLSDLTSTLAASTTFL